MRLITGSAGLACLWLLMSGIYDKSLILIFGVLSVALTIWIATRIDAADSEHLEYSISPFAAVRYVVWLLIEIARSNWAVTKIILAGRMPQGQKMFMVPVTQKTEIGQVIFANSITLTPGTITVETENDQFIVHALDYTSGDDEALANMDAHVSAIELPGAGGGI